MKKLWREPLLHFLLLGTALFVVYALINPPDDDQPKLDQIIVSKAQIENLANGYARTWQRPPTPQELMALVRDRIREEVYCRQAIAMGLDTDDTIIRRRLRQKMEFITNDLVVQTQPTDAELEACLLAHANIFRRDDLFTFRHVYLNAQKRGESAQRDAEQILLQLKQEGDAINFAELGDRLLLDPLYTNLPAGEAAKLFGPSFAASLAALTSGQWHGPVKSGYGIHLVFIEERTQGNLLALDQVRDVVQQTWETTQREQANEKLYKEMLSQYTVIIEGLELDEENATNLGDNRAP